MGEVWSDGGGEREMEVKDGAEMRKEGWERRTGRGMNKSHHR